MTTAHAWAVDIARINPDDVKAWVEGAKGSKWWAPVLILTERELIWAKRGFIRKAAHRVPRKNISSVAYNTGVMWDTITLNVAGGDLPDTSIKVNRKNRAAAEELVDLLRHQLNE